MAPDEQRAAQQRATQQRATQQKATQQRATQQKATQQRATQQRSAQQRAAQQRAAQPRTAAARSAARPAPAQTDEFARLVQRNTVDVRDHQARTPRRRNPLIGKIALGMAVVCAAVDASAFAVFVGGDTTFAFGICFVVVFLTLVAAVLGFIAAVGSFGRWYGAIGVVVAFLANPVILIVLVVIVAPELLTDMGGSTP
ncbi:hypothetical protein Csp2054_02800 [Curtobacterium sp. 'Ferrero']|uniref:hypothetical protein n=1 Tax=Curtobacterium sp. 'Ferrero' TaxID=2033654 RepID=UPI000BDC672D|nr:hypothetical protein [Curtobacterium sp. 'Ferrero']PCN49139.1 hypothetical protein Csp2054_02800 [Curtobacterium sp. 'Ferrero']